jgi:DNA repair exonuclease SbcCD ATPase subunit
MGKRAANPASVKAAAKKAKVVDAGFASIGDALMEAEQLPERVRTMLVQMLPHTLHFGSDERHDLQSLAVDMVEESMSGRKAALEANATAEEHALATLKASESTLGTTVDTAESALSAQKEVAQAKKTALAEAKVATKDSDKSLKEKRAAVKDGANNAEKMQKEKAGIEQAFAEHFQPMVDGGDGKAHLKKLEPFLQKIDIESTLLKALPSSVAKAKEARGTFDHLVLEQLQKAFDVKIASLGAAVEGEGPAAAQREADLQAAEKDHEAKQVAQTQAAAESEAADKEQTERQAALTAAKDAVENFQPQVEEVEGRLSNARTALAEFEAGPLVNFKTYKTRVAAVPEEPAAEE